MLAFHNSSLLAKLWSTDIQFISKDTSDNDDYVKELNDPSIKSLAEAVRITHPLRRLAQFYGYQDLALSIWKANDLISPIQVQAPKRQTLEMDYFR